MEVFLAVATIATPILLIAQMFQSWIRDVRQKMPVFSCSLREYGSDTYLLDIDCYGGGTPEIFHAITVKNCLIQEVRHQDMGDLIDPDPALWNIEKLEKYINLESYQFHQPSRGYPQFESGVRPTSFSFWIKPSKSFSILEIRLHNIRMFRSISLKKPMTPKPMMRSEAQIDKN